MFSHFWWLKSLPPGASKGHWPWALPIMINMYTCINRYTNTEKPRYNKVLGTMKITMLYQVSHYIRVKKLKKYKELGPAKLPCYKQGFVISDLFITRFHCTHTLSHTHTHIHTNTHIHYQFEKKLIKQNMHDFYHWSVAHSVWSYMAKIAP